jgi:hypothetical protein
VVNHGGKMQEEIKEYKIWYEFDYAVLVAKDSPLIVLWLQIGKAPGMGNSLKFWVITTPGQNPQPSE